MRMTSCMSLLERSKIWYTFFQITINFVRSAGPGGCNGFDKDFSVEKTEGGGGVLKRTKISQRKSSNAILWIIVAL
jgi:hypothetical protein